MCIQSNVRLILIHVRQPQPEQRRQLVRRHRTAVEERPLAPADFATITAALRKVMQAAVATGNPVRWH